MAEGSGWHRWKNWPRLGFGEPALIAAGWIPEANKAKPVET